MVEIKFCGLTRSEDAAHAATLGASYCGAIFAESPRRVTAPQARSVFAALPKSVKRVGVFGATSPGEIARIADEAQLDVVQLHSDPDPATIAVVRKVFRGLVWAVRRVSGRDLPDDLAPLFDVADGVVLDARVEGKLGGTGVALPWQSLRAQLDKQRGRTARLVLAGGLNPTNVARAIADMEPDIVDVSSGVEAAPGVKDHALMRAFRDAALATALR